MKIIKSGALFAALSVVAFSSFAGDRLTLAGLEAHVSVVRDRFGVPHISARNDHDVYFMQGYIHAGDRFFQMDASRRQASGTLAELLGPTALPGDVQLRTLGLRRGAERSLAAYPPEVQAVVRAYAEGVNAWLAQGALPPEYAALELTQVPAWTPLDTVSVGKLLAFGLSFDTIDLDNTRALLTYQGFGAALGFNGTKLFFDDLFRSAPFDRTISIPEGVVSGPVRERQHGRADHADGESVEKARRFLERPAPFFAPHGRGEGGSNWWVVSGTKTESRNPMLASDPHLSLSSPSVFHEVHLIVSRGRSQEPLDVYGVGFPGVPGVVHGYNRRIMWGSTVNPMDVTDYFQEQLVLQGGIPVATMFRGTAEPLAIIPEIYRANIVGDGVQDSVVPITAGVPPATFVVPRRNNGPLVTAPAADASGRITAISVQYTGFSATREIETFLRFGRAGTVEEFKQALQFFDVGSQNWAYADVDGNIAYFTSAELPLREDLQAGTVDGLPPYFVRDGTGALRHEWIRKDNRPADQAIAYEILPFAEMPQLVNPARGYIANGNNDPIGVTLDNDPLNKPRAGGQGILYLSPGYAIGNRMGRIDRLIRHELARHDRHGGEISFEDMIRIQADVKLLDAEVLTPFILRAFDSSCVAGAPAMLAAFCNDSAIAEAVAPPAPLGLQHADRHRGGLRRRRPPRQALEADARRDREQRGGHHLLGLARPGAAQRDRWDACARRPGRQRAARRPRDDRIAPSARDFPRQRIGPELLRRAGRDAGTRRRARPGAAPKPQGGARSSRLTGVRGRLRAIDRPGRLPLGQAAPHRAQASAQQRAVQRRAAGDRRRLRRGRRLVAQPARRVARRLHVLERAVEALHRRGAPLGNSCAAGDSGRRERRAGHAVLREPGRALGDERLP